MVKNKSPSVLKSLGPGLITGAADDDPSGIATYSQGGAQFGFGMLWTLLLTYPLMVGIQIISARIGCVSGQGLASNIRLHYPKVILYFITGLLLLANVINIAADVAAMGGASQLLMGGSPQVYAVGFGLLSLTLQVFVPYHRYVRFLKWLTLGLLAYVATVFVIHVPWSKVLVETFIPHLTFNSDYVTTVVAIFGTTISPYLFFWQASQEVEELKQNSLGEGLRDRPQIAKRNLKRIKIDTLVGMGFSNLVAYFIILTTGVTLHTHGILNIETSEQAAVALRPLAGQFAFLLFSLGIIGTGLLAIPVLAGSAAYAMTEALNWGGSLEAKPKAAKKFYGIIVIATTIGVLLGFSSFNPIKALYWSAVLNGVISVPIMVVMMLMAVRPDIMGDFTITNRLKILGWLATLIMALAVGTMFWQAI